MTEKKNLVIKVKYPTGAKAKTVEPSGAIIQVWDYQRIGLAVSGLLGLIIFIGLALSGGDVDPEPVVQAVGQQDQAVAMTGQNPVPSVAAPVSAMKFVDPAPKSVVAKPAVVASSAPNKATAPTLSQELPRLRRAVLATSITNKEPGNEMTDGVRLQPGKLTTVYYFNELRGMNGKILYHEWSHNGASVVKEPLLVGADRWRVSSHKTFDDQGDGNWTVKLLDDTGKVLHEKSFAVNVGQ